MNAKKWLIGWLLLTMSALCVMGGLVYKIDPYFHYHEPDLEHYFYPLNNQRSQNDGISKHFTYNAIITGTSMTENFKTSEMDEIFGVNSIKVSFSGGTYKEMNDNLQVALKHNSDIKTIVRCLDYEKIFDDKDLMRDDLGGYPTYLYDDNLLNDVKYLCNKDVIWGRVYPILKTKSEGGITGITSFDDYSRWQQYYNFEKKNVIEAYKKNKKNVFISELNEDVKLKIKGNIFQNVTSLADQYPEVDFYYFFSPYSIVWWNGIVDNGSINKWIEAEKYIIELILEHPNIHLYSFNNRTDITTDLNHYKDLTHYGEWINSAMLQWMYDGKYLLTKENYQDYLNAELEFYSNFDYTSINDQEDYESDYYAAALINQELTGAEPISLLENDEVEINLSGAQIVEHQYDGSKGIQCVGSLQRECESDIPISEYLIHNEYVGGKMSISDIGEHNYLVFYGKKTAGNGQPSVLVYDENNEKIGELSAYYGDIDNEWHQYVIDLSKVDGAVTIIFNGGYIDKSGSPDSEYIFSEIKLY